MDRRISAALLGIILVTGAVQAQAPGGPASAPATGPAGRLSEPGDKPQAEALKMVRRVFQDEYARTGKAERAALARKLLEEAGATKDDVAAKFVLLEQAGEVAAQAGEAELAVRAVEELARTFEIRTPLLRKVRVLTSAGAASPTTAQWETLATVSLRVMDEAVREDQFDLGQRMLTLAELSADRSKKVAVVGLVRGREGEFRAMEDEFKQVQKATERLKTAPEEAEPNWVVGRYYCFLKGQWERGLPGLARSPEPTVRQLAGRELAGVSDPLKQVELADAWWTLAEKLAGPARAHVAAHAVGWYERAHQGITGITLTRVAQRIKAGEPEKPGAATQAVVEGTDLLKRIEPERDAVAGAWKFSDGALVVAPERNARLQIRGPVPREYDLVVEFTRLQGDGPVVLLLVGKSAAFGLELDIKGEARFETVGKKINADNPTKAPCELVNGQRHTATVQVRRDGVRALLDGKGATAWKADQGDLGRYSPWKLKDEKLLGLGAGRAKVAFHRVTLIEPRDGK